MSDAPTVEPSFTKLLKGLPSHIQKLAAKVIADPRATAARGKRLKSLPKKASASSGSYRVWVGRDYRAIARELPDGTLSWYWIGAKHDYERYIGNK